MSRTKRFMGMVALLASMGVLGTAGGLSVRSALASELPGAGGGCQNDECEAKKTCVDNSGGNTECSFEGTICNTVGCGATVE